MTEDIGSAGGGRVLDPIDRVSEVLFGLFMVLAGTKPWRTGMIMVLLGTFVEAIIIALGG